MQRCLLGLGLALVSLACLPATREGDVGSSRSGLVADGKLEVVRGAPSSPSGLTVLVTERRGRRTHPLPGAKIHLYRQGQGSPAEPMLVAQTYEGGQAQFTVPATAVYSVRVAAVGHRRAIADILLTAGATDTLRAELAYHRCMIE